MIACIRPSILKGTFESKPSKSMMQRALALALMHKGITRIHHYGNSEDDLAAQNIIKTCGAEIHLEKDTLIIHSEGIMKAPAVIDCGESGLSLRMFSILLSVMPQTVKYVGQGSLNNRTMLPLVSLLHQLGAEVVTTDGKLPLQISGPIQPQNISFKADASSQYLTGLLFALATSASTLIELKVTDLVSKGYVDLSVSMLRRFGYHIKQKDESFYIQPRSMPYNDMDIHIEGDWSGAAFFMVWGSIHGGLTISGLREDAVQPDRMIIEVVSRCGAKYEIHDGKFIFDTPQQLTTFSFDATDCPDLFPPLVVLAASIKGHSQIQGVSRLYNKESNRADALVNEFGKMGVDIDIKEDVMHIHGGQTIKGATVVSHHDHRIAMALAMMALMADQQTVIHDAEAVEKSFPDFFETLQLLGADVSLTNIETI